MFTSLKVKENSLNIKMREKNWYKFPLKIKWNFLSKQIKSHSKSGNSEAVRWHVQREERNVLIYWGIFSLIRIKYFLG